MKQPHSPVIAGAEALKVYFKIGGMMSRQILRAVDDVSLEIRQGEVLGIVGESGSGKTTFGRALLRLNEPESGRISFDGQDITRHSTKEMRPIRKQMQLVYQDPNSSLNPRMKLRDIIGEPLVVNQMGTRSEREQRIREVLEHVQLPPDCLDRYPRQLSGGQRQRVAIARALITRPKLLVADEPVSALDVSVQAQILNLLSDLRDQLGLTIVMISHDLSVVQYLSDRVAIMYLGKVMEIGQSEHIFAQPAHPYTRALLDAVPEPDPERRKAASAIAGDMPSPLNPPSGCVFRTRCQLASAECERVIPKLTAMKEGHEAACLKLNDNRAEHVEENQRKSGKAV